MERFQVKVAVYLLLVKDGKILLSRRVNTGWQDGNYGLPAGHMESNETIVEALIREVKEEIGITLGPEDIKLVHTLHRLSRYIDFFFTTTNLNQTPQNMEPERCDDIQWFPLESLPNNIIPSVKHAIYSIQRRHSILGRLV